jgi:predicted Rossmann-fold nucleotide-binding protein
MFPIIIFDKAFYKYILAHNERMLHEGTVSMPDTKLFFVTDSIEQAVAYIKEKSIVGFGLSYAKQPKPLWGLFEKGIKSSSPTYNPE